MWRNTDWLTALPHHFAALVLGQALPRLVWTLLDLVRLGDGRSEGMTRTTPETSEPQTPAARSCRTRWTHLTCLRYLHFPSLWDLAVSEVEASRCSSERDARFLQGNQDTVCLPEHTEGSPALFHRTKKGLGRPFEYFERSANLDSTFPT
jgi:hypothetical protein